VIPFVLGLLVGELLSAWLRLDATVALVAAAVSGTLVALIRRPVLATTFCCLAAGFIGLWVASRAVEPPVDDCFLPPPDQVTKRWIEAAIDEAPSFAGGSLRFRATVRAPEHDPDRICGQTLMTIREPPAGLVVGDRVRLHASLRRPRDFANPRTYAYAEGLARRGVWTTAHASGATIVRLESEPRASRLEVERQRIGGLISNSLPPGEAALLRALVIGDEASVAPEDWEAITTAGLAHLLSVSGLHIALVWGLLFAVTRWTLGRSERLLLHADVKMLAATVALPAAGLYAALAGLSVPAARSVAMTALCVSSLILGREASAPRVLVLAAAGIALLSPGAVLDVSFQLSFASVLALMLASRAWSRRQRPIVPPDRVARIREAAILSMIVPAAALLGTAPLVALHFNRVTPIGLLTNPILVPLAGTPATVLGLAGAAASFVSESCARAAFQLAYWPLAALRLGAAYAAALPMASIRIPTPTLVELGIAYTLLALPWIARPWRRPLAAIALGSLALDAAWWVQERWLDESVRVRFLDVGQGDAAVLELPGGQVAVVDGGGFARSGFDVGERVIAPYLWSRKIRRVDVLVATHGDWDHQGGLHFLAREFAPRELWMGASGAERRRLARLEDTVRAGGGRVRVVRAGEMAYDDRGVSIECLHSSDGESASANDSSLVLRVRFGHHVLLFTGDVEATAEDVVTSSFAPELVNVLKVPHHGSATSSGASLLRWARPEIAVFSLGVGNSYGFPNPAVLERYRGTGARMLRTDRDGSVWVATDGARMEVRTTASTPRMLCAITGALC
jgi:competence protein ComEC